MSKSRQSYATCVGAWAGCAGSLMHACFLKDFLCVWSLTTEASYTAIFHFLSNHQAFRVGWWWFSGYVLPVGSELCHPSLWLCFPLLSSNSPSFCLSQTLSAMVLMLLQLSPSTLWPPLLLLALSDAFPLTRLLFSDLLLCQRCIAANLEMNRPWKIMLQKFMQ